MPQITINASGPSKGSIVETAYDFCGLSSDQYERTPEEMAKGLRLLNSLMSWLKLGKGIDLSYIQPRYGEGLLEEPSGIDTGAREPVAALLAQRIAPTIGASLTDDAGAILSNAVADLYAYTAPAPIARKPAYKFVSAARRHSWWRCLCPTTTDTTTTTTTPAPTPVPTSPTPTKPVNTAAPVVTGTAQSGQLLSCTTGTWDNTPTSYAYNWLRDGAFITGANASTYTLTDADVGATIICAVTAVNAAGSATANSNSVGPVATLAPVNTVLPAITGTAQDGQTLTLSNGTWLNSPTSFAYQWNKNGAIIPGATSNTYAVVTADVGANITCTVGASNIHGIGSATSAAVGPVLPAAPVNTVAPVISGTATQGQTLTLTNNGTWTNSPTSFARQWKRNGVAITGETGTTYLLASADVGTTVTCAVTATNAGGSNSAASNGMGPIVGSGGLATPTLTNFSALGTTPVVLEWSDTDYVAGLYAQLQIDGNSDFSSPEQNIVFFIDGDSWARLDESIGLLSPTGTYNARIRTCRENESGATTVTGTDPAGNAVSFNADVSAWSTTFTDTITSSSATLSTVNGANKSHFLTVSGTPPLSFAGAGGLNSGQGDRATIVQQSDWAQWEVTWTAVPSAGNFAYFGYCNATDNFDDGTFPKPGFSNSNGIALGLDGSFGISVWVNGGTIAASLTSEVAVAGDIYTLRLKKSTNTLQVYRTRSGSTAQLGSDVTGLPTLTAYYAFVEPMNGESGTCNFGGSTFAKALDTGVAIYG